jgi:hypothetical protein
MVFVEESIHPLAAIAARIAQVADVPPSIPAISDPTNGRRALKLGWSGLSRRPIGQLLSTLVRLAVTITPTAIAAAGSAQQDRDGQQPEARVPYPVEVVRGAKPEQYKASARTPYF